ncbi:hypothetical protein [Notoacmeibacter sp. MSK16QG-6]|uniref:hypothetical protein n=1 Tax=Notoacmeibacter sp. MSK16QG-6 TaxID=2957982 RepID=UPI0020A001A7|nr:hypothetical protein [Notoacmeibacter sp. MSK16QG-6]MCP1200073.1 hypothetical protein [Notoacmeibacter sp. MSK16QG-6]
MTDALAEMRERIDLLEEENRQLRGLLAPPDGPEPPCHLPRRQLALFRMLATGRRITHNAAMIGVYGADSEEWPDDQNIYILIAHLRKALNPFGYRISTHRYEGWKLEWPDPAGGAS